LPRAATHTHSHPLVITPHFGALQVIQLAFLVACMYTGVGVLRLGFMVRFLSHSVITGFTSGAQAGGGVGRRGGGEAWGGEGRHQCCWVTTCKNLQRVSVDSDLLHGALPQPLCHYWLHIRWAGGGGGEEGLG
jgi:hypothetical protein